MEQRASVKQLQEKLLDVEKHGLKELKKLLIPLIVMTIALNPHSATVFMMEYFKVDPSLSFLIMQYALPVLIGISMARVISLLWIFPIRQFVGYSIFLIWLPVLWVLRKTKSQYFNKLCNWTDNSKKKEDLRYIQTKETGLERELFFINRSFTILFTSVLYLAQFFNNPIGQLWNPIYNKKLMIITNVHYYCQLTGNYNEDQCKKWKVDMAEYNRKMVK